MQPCVQSWLPCRVLQFAVGSTPSTWVPHWTWAWRWTRAWHWSVFGNWLKHDYLYTELQLSSRHSVLPAQLRFPFAYQTLLLYFLHRRCYKIFKPRPKYWEPWLRLNKGSAEASQRTANLFVEIEFVCSELRLKRENEKTVVLMQNTSMISCEKKKIKLNPASYNNRTRLFNMCAVWAVADGWILSGSTGWCPEDT